MSFLKQNRAALLLLLAGAVCVAIGGWRGGAEPVVRQAVNICMECIGLG